MGETDLEAAAQLMFEQGKVIIDAAIAEATAAERETIAHLRAALRRHMEWFPGKRGVKLCGGCLNPVPCPDAVLLGEERDRG